MNKLAIILITLYQKYISPHKGYCCAYSSFYKKDSCSKSIKKIIINKGIVRGWSDIKGQFEACSLAYEKIQNENKKDKNKKKKDKDSWCDFSPCEAINCIPTKFCKGKSDCGTDGGCDLPCDCSPF